MSRLISSSPTRRAADPRIAVGAAVLALLAVIGTAPTPDAPLVETVPVAESGEQTFAELFQEMREPERHGEGQQAVAVATAVPDIPTVDGGPAEDADTTAVALVPPVVTSVRPSHVIRGVDPALAEQIAGVDGVAAAAAATTGSVAVRGPAGPQMVTIAAVDPLAFRPLTPDLTAAEPAVWERLLAGEAAFTHDAGTKLGAPLGSTVPTIATVPSAAPAEAGAADEGGAALGQGEVGELAAGDAASSVVARPAPAGIPIRLGALASNGIPPVADALVSEEVGRALGLQGAADVYVGVAEGAEEEAVADAIAAATGAQVERLAPPETQTTTFGAFLVGSEAQSFFEPFDYIDHGDGLITIEQGWVDRNIASTTMIPLLNGTVTCHRQMLRQLYAAMSEVEAAGLGPLIDPSQYGGCWVARHIDFNPSKPISMHGWGLAVDLNVSTNGLGARPTLDPRIVEIFDRWGFVWGGRWSRPDGMHFEIGAVIDVPVPEGFFR